MRMVVSAVYDRRMAGYMQPFIVSRTVGEAERLFMNACASKDDNNLRAHPEDFVLMNIGSFDDETGMFTQSSSGPGPIMTALEAVASE